MPISEHAQINTELLSRAYLVLWTPDVWGWLRGGRNHSRSAK